MADLAFRLLPRAKGPNLRLLDYGCGGGEYLQLVANAGWRGYGVEPDPQARQIAISRGFDVRASLGEFDGEAFGYVTISHVIEHVHWPAQVIARLFEMTVPHGGLFIATPNMDAVGHDIYGRNWRGLETPRHLVIPTRRSLQAMVERAGYNSLKFHRSKGALAFTALQSRRIACRADPYDDHAPAIARQPTRHETREADGNRTKAEFLILTARKA
jgi:2-polyprenyl-3-methyl-5-hydroxy-6-metoxy-1,4-benzoquinol methylase